MNINFQRTIDRYFGVLICRILSIFAGKNHTDVINPENFLIILLSEMGSLVLARPMFEHIKRTYPDANIHVLLFEQNREIVQLLDVVQEERVLSVTNQNLTKFMISSFRAVKQMRKYKIDTVIDCELFSRISSIFSFLSGAKLRVGFHPHNQEGLYRGDFINRPVLYNPYTHISQQFINLAKAVESIGMPRVKRELKNDKLKLGGINFSKEEEQTILDRFARDYPGKDLKKSVLLYPGGGLLPIRAWAVDSFAEVALNLLKHGWQVGIIGLKEDTPLAQKILGFCGDDNCFDLTGYTKTLKELVILLKHVSLLITNDGGPGHFASLTQTPAIIFFGPETPALYGSLSPYAYHFYTSFSCSPCLTAYNHRNSPCDNNNVCLKQISPQEVTAKAIEMLTCLSGNG